MVQKINSPFIRLQLDCFHLQFIHGNLTNRIKEALPYIGMKKSITCNYNSFLDLTPLLLYSCTGHIQIAQVPDRNEPDSLGEIDYQYILLYLQTLQYGGWVGLEYKPLEATTKGLDWIKKLGFKL